MKHSVAQTLLVHPHPLEREAVAEWLQKKSSIGLVGKSSSLEKVARLPYLADIDIIIAYAYEAESVAAQIITLRKSRPGLRFLLMGTSSCTKWVSEIVRSGVSGFIAIDSELDEWEYAIKAVSEGKIYYGQEVIMKLSEAPSDQNDCQPVTSSTHFLTKREIEILRLVASEYSTNSIADQLFISGKTVETHRRNLFQKLGVKNSVGLTKVAVRLGVV
ncbi:response regulator transcription factor [Dyadobacter sp. CY347]|uniref:response regulator transcription factor n=1 Tax=Dyadobacter sp. CY347 TaxID=2909336 RepID=UPI0027152C60|nr:response regulator transcription factor [Dyadobacter sp. CY347]